MSSGFVTETELAEARKKRQEEWEKVRKPEDPIERPEEQFDGRSLFERLQEQKMKKDMEYEEAHKLKNLIRGLDDDEIQFLEQVDQQKLNAELKQNKQDEQELQDFRQRLAKIQEEAAQKNLQTELASKQTTTKAKNSNNDAVLRPTQKSLLNLGIKRKAEDVQKPSIAEAAAATAVYDQGALKCVGILPGIGPYSDSEDSERTSGSDEGKDEHCKYDLVGRKRLKKKSCLDDC